MKALVNGHEAELSPTGVEIHATGNRLLVRTSEGTKSAAVVRRGNATLISFDGRVYQVEKPSAGRTGEKGAGSGESRAPMPGLVVEVLVEPGAQVQAGDRLLIIEAMKMQQPIVAGIAGVVKSIGVAPGEQVADGQLLAEVEPSE